VLCEEEKKHQAQALSRRCDALHPFHFRFHFYFSSKTGYRYDMIHRLTVEEILHPEEEEEKKRFTPD